MTTKIIAGDLAVAGEVKIDNTISSLGNIILKLDKDADSSNSYFAITDNGEDSEGHSDFINNLVTVTSSGVGIRDNITAFGGLSAVQDISSSLGNIVSYSGSVLTKKVASTTNLLLQIDSDDNSTSGVLAVTRNGGTTTLVETFGDTLLALNESGNMVVLGGLTTLTGSIAALSGSVATTKVASTSSLILQIDSNGGSSDSVLAVTKNGGTSTAVTSGGNTLLTLSEYGNMAVLGSVTATNVTTFTGSHVYPSLTDLSDHAGAVVELVEGSHIELCSTAESKKVAGILVSCKPKEEFGTSSLGEIPESMGFICTVAAVGDSRTSNLLGVKVCDEGGALEPGDLLVTSSRAGYLKKQQDDIIRASTVAKVMQPVTFDDTGAATGVYSYVYCG